MSSLKTFTEPKGKQKQLRFYIDVTAFQQRFGSGKYLTAIGEVHAAIKAIGAIRGKNSDGTKQQVVKFFPVSESKNADIFLTIGPVDGVGDMDVRVEDIVGATKFQHHEGTGKPYAQIVMDEEQDWGIGERLPWLKRLFSREKISLKRWVIHEWLHAVGVPHTNPGHFRSLMDEGNWTDNDPTIPEYDEAALCRVHGFSHPFEKYL